MREIKFRGKRIDNGEWVYGHYIKVTPYNDSDGHRIGTQDTWDMFHVIPETVGQYTGLKDKNGKEIYEGDIFDLRYAKNNAHRYAYVDFYNAQFRMVEGTGYICSLNQYNFEKLEGIGNIRENPELLKESE